MTVDKIRSLADLQPGDLMFGPIGGIVPGLFPVAVGQAMLADTFRAGRMSVRHVGIVVANDLPGERGGKRLVQAMPRGAEEIPMTPATHWTDRHAYVRIPEDYPGQASDAAAIARAMIGTPYSFASYAALAAWQWGVKTPRLEAWINRRREPIEIQGMHPVLKARREPIEIALPCEAICSVLADQAWSLAGKRVMEGTAPQVVTPGALARRVFYGMEGAIWGGKGFLRP